MKPPKHLSEKQGAGLLLATGSTHPELGQAVADTLHVSLDDTERHMFSDDENYVHFGSSARGKHVVVIQSQASRGPDWKINDAVLETFLLADAARGASAREITMVLPHFAYARQDRKARGREPNSAALMMRFLAYSGVNRVVSVDLHSPQTQGAFVGPSDHLTAEPLLRKALQECIGEGEEVVVVAPDVGRAKQAELYAHRLGVDVVNMPKVRDKKDSSKILRPQIPQGVRNMTCLMIDDMFDTTGTLVSAAQSLHDQGATRIVAAATHGLFSDPALERLQTAPIDQIIVTDTIPQADTAEALGSRLSVVSIAPLLGRAIREIYTNGSISKIFTEQQHYM